MKKDPIENTTIYQKVSLLVDEMAELELKQKGIQEGMPNYLSIYWGIRKRILKDTFQIDWHTPEELNPESIFN